MPITTQSFQKIIKLAAQPLKSSSRTKKVVSGGYSGKKTRSRKTANT